MCDLNLFYSLRCICKKWAILCFRKNWNAYFWRADLAIGLAAEALVFSKHPLGAFLSMFAILSDHLVKFSLEFKIRMARTKVFMFWRLQIRALAIPVIICNETYSKLSEKYTFVIHFFFIGPAAYAKSEQSWFLGKNKMRFCGGPISQSALQRKL